ncbi:hypothetical protein PGIGA_G00233390 [Pangasianodon gigas]|uniref:Uncharacterized protein n=1 Tax=Pangasianodon gigas TaxID=30993 RepID=A0ACC5WLW6_PANGG|nr:hypothetical protein [Pangasianodon gigas]
MGLLKTPTSVLWDDSVNHGANQKRQQAEQSWALFGYYDFPTLKLLLNWSRLNLVPIITTCIINIWIY